jgi:chromosomal replication initiation ATPase DnaA
MKALHPVKRSTPILTDEIKQYLIENYKHTTQFELKWKYNVSAYRLIGWIKELKLCKVETERGRPLQYTPADLEFLLLMVAGVSNIDVDTLKGKRRPVEIVIARQMYCYIAFRYTENSMDNIGKHIGRDHTTVLHSITTINNGLYIGYDTITTLLRRCENRLPQSFKRVYRVGRWQRLNKAS